MPEYDATPTDKVRRLQERAEQNAVGGHPAGYRPQLEPDPAGWLVVQLHHSGDEAVFECARCGALTTYDGVDVHAHWHSTHGDFEPL